MTRERYIPEDNQWVDFPEFESTAFVEAVYEEVGERFSLTVQSNGRVLLDAGDLPDGVSETDVKQAVRDNHPHR